MHPEGDENAIAFHVITRLLSLDLTRCALAEEDATRMPSAAATTGDDLHRLDRVKIHCGVTK